MKFDITTLKAYHANPRKPLSDKAKELLDKSLNEFSKMLELRPIVYDPETMETLGGNKRLERLIQLGFTEVPEQWVKSAEGFTEEEKKRFIITDNTDFGTQWDFDILQSEFSEFDFGDFDLRIPETPNIQDYSDKNKEIDVDDFSDTMTIKLSYVEDDYFKVRDALSKIAATPEQAVFKLLGLTENE
jgi:hypothetical protein